jgi:hypothetical protein
MNRKEQFRIWKTGQITDSKRSEENFPRPTRIIGLTDCGSEHMKGRIEK